MDKLIINGKTFLIDQVLRDFKEIDPGDEFEREILKFTHNWLSGQQTFTITTSGSTGKPKPIAITREQMKLSAAMTLKALDLHEGDTALLCLNPMYIAGKMMIVRALEANMTLVAVTPTANPLRKLTEAIKIDFTALVPYQLKTVLKEGGKSSLKLNYMKGILLGGGPVDGSLETMVQSVNAPVYATFAMTETVSHFALRRINGPDRSIYFRVLENNRISTDDRGCLCVRGPVTK